MEKNRTPKNPSVYDQFVYKFSINILTIKRIPTIKNFYLIDIPFQPKTY